jgi:hypothetical protein
LLALRRERYQQRRGLRINPARFRAMPVEVSTKFWRLPFLSSLFTEEFIRHEGCGRDSGSPQLERMEQRLATQNAVRVKRRTTTMANDDRDILELLKEELAFVEQGGYGRSVRTPWLPKSAFQDSLTCINYGYAYRAHSCSECHLIDFVAGEQRDEAVPCHCIPLNAAGETIADLEAENNQPKLEATLKQWMRTKIQEIEEARAPRAELQSVV